jgi:hypothetical protein
MDNTPPKASGFLNAAKPAAAGQRGALGMNVPKPKTDTHALFSRFPHLRRIEAIWGTRECREFITELMSDSRGDRQGFPVEHASTLIALLMEHDEVFPQFDAVQTGMSATGVKLWR